ncbi:MAG: N-acetylmuramoyl-L-alanine amidase [Lachnospiraceae bacterium]
MTDKKKTPVGNYNKRRRGRHRLQTLTRWLLCLALMAVIILIFAYLDKWLNDGKIFDQLINSGQTTEVTETTETDQNNVAEVEDDHVFTVCIDPGHGGIDRGSEGNGREEAVDTLVLGLLLKESLENMGINVVMTRETDDIKVTLKERVAIANNAEADIFISLHRNTGDGYGLEIWESEFTSEVTSALSNTINDALVAVGVQRNRGVKKGSESGEGGYYVLDNTSMPATLIELGFMNDSTDNALFDEHITEYAEAIANAVREISDTYFSGGSTQNSDSNSETVISEDTEDSLTTAESLNLESSSETVEQLGYQITNAVIEDVSSRSDTSVEWGYGINMDSSNRPLSCLTNEQKYENYPVDFIRDTSSKVIYLTFDVEEEAGYTSKYLNVLAQKGVPAVFFVTKSYAEENPEMVSSMISQGITVGNHSTTHPEEGLTSLNLAEQTDEIMNFHDYMTENFNYNMCLFRFPGGIFSEQSLAVVNNLNYRSVFWSFSYMDYDTENQPVESEALETLLSSLHPGAIYLLHGVSETNAEVLGDFIDQARAAGYEFSAYEDMIN